MDRVLTVAEGLNDPERGAGGDQRGAGCDAGPAAAEDRVRTPVVERELDHEPRERSGPGDPAQDVPVAAGGDAHEQPEGSHGPEHAVHLRRRTGEASHGPPMADIDRPATAGRGSADKPLLPFMFENGDAKLNRDQ